MKRKGEALWTGTGKDGNGHLTTQSNVLNKTQYSFSSRFENGLKQVAEKCMGFRDTKTGSREKDSMLVEFANARRKSAGSISGNDPMTEVT